MKLFEEKNLIENWFKLIKNEKTEEIELFLIKKPNFNINLKNEKQKTALMIIVKKSQNEKIVNILLNKNSDLNEKNKKGKSILEIALINNNNEKIINLIVKKKFGLIQKKIDKTKLKKIKKIKKNPKIDKFQKKEDINKKITKNGNTFFIIASKHTNNIKILKTLIKYGSDPDFQNNLGNTALMLSLKYNKNPLIILYIIQQTKNINIKNSQKWTSLMFFVKYSNNIEILEKLINKKIHINSENKTGWNSLMLAAVQNPCEKIFQILLKNFADVQKKNIYNQNAFFLSQKNDNIKIGVLLIKNNNNIFINEDYLFTYIHFFYLYFEESYLCEEDFFRGLKENNLKCFFGWNGDFYRKWKKRERNIEYMRIFYNN